MGLMVACGSLPCLRFWSFSCLAVELLDLQSCCLDAWCCCRLPWWCPLSWAAAEEAAPRWYNYLVFTSLSSLGFPLMIPRRLSFAPSSGSSVSEMLRPGRRVTDPSETRLYQIIRRQIKALTDGIFLLRYNLCLFAEPRRPLLRPSRSPDLQSSSSVSEASRP